MKLNIKNQISKFLIFASCILIFSPGCGIDQRASAISSKEILVINLSEKPEYQQLLTGKPQTCGMRSGRVYLLPGQSCGQHSTEAHEELLVFLLGKGTALIGREQKAFEIGQGKICYIPPHTIHDMKNTGIEPFVYIYCVAPVKY
jgi:quercetin dioxygenase-like cupin family protein